MFSDLNEQFDHRPTGLVGRNGVGKTVLARLMAGLVAPTSGQCVRSGSVHYLAQQVASPAGATVADLAGVKHQLDALARIEAGGTAVADFEAVGDQWDLRDRFRHALESSGLGYIEADTPASRLSGGEAMRVSLLGAMLSEADCLILDEPSNHLDRPNRRALIRQLQSWPRGLIVVSHDRQLLDAMERIVELSPLGLRSYGGNYAFYASAKEQEQQAALENLNALKVERRRRELAIRKQRERQEKRQARGNRQGKVANQSKILLDRQKERSEASSGAQRQQQAASREQLNQQVRDAAQQVAKDSTIALRSLPVTQVAKRRVAELEAVTLPFVSGPTGRVSLLVHGQQRLGVVGPNGCGKSTLLRVLAGQISPLSGVCHVAAECAFLDQQLDTLDPGRPVLEQLQSANPAAAEGDLRMRLAHLGLDAQTVTTPSGSLSGGERLKGALACLLYAESPPHLLLLDEPSNHLDLPSAHALEAMLLGYQGALIVVSHDDAFLEGIELTDRLVATDQGWRLETV